MKPIYSEQLIVGIIDGDSFSWYILDKEWCYMDCQKFTEVFLEHGYDVPDDPTFRFGIEVLNSETKHMFLNYIKPYQVKSEVLKYQLKNTDEDRLAYNYSVLIDFDKCLFISFYSEMEEFENYVPKGWNGLYMDFSEYIPSKDRYWIDNGNNLILD